MAARTTRGSAPMLATTCERAKDGGMEAAVLCPIGFVSDHIEVLYDLDHEAAAVARELGLVITRADAVNDDPLFLDMMADVTLATIRKYATGWPLALVGSEVS